jgi:hypothetical protein
VNTGNVQVRVAAAEEGGDPGAVAALEDQRQDELRRVTLVEADDDQRRGFAREPDMAIPLGSPFEPLVGRRQCIARCEPVPQRLCRGEVAEHVDACERRARALRAKPDRGRQNG